jgi:cell division protein FtsW
MIDRVLFVTVILLMGFSLMMTYSLSVYTVIYSSSGEFSFFIRQLMAIAVGIGTMLFLSRLDPDKWFNIIGLSLFIVFLIIMILMPFLPSSLVSATGGAKRWISLGFIKISPVEFFKIGFVFFISWSFSRKLLHRKNMSFGEELLAYLPYLFVFMIAVVLIAVIQKDLGQTMVLGLTLMIMLFFSGSSFKFFLSLVGAGLVGMLILIKMAPHRISRVLEWWAGVQDPVLAALPFDWLESLRVDMISKEPYQVSNSLNAINHGGLFGTGLGNGQFKLGYLSDVHTDFVLAGITEEFGFIGLMGVTFAIMLIIFRLFRMAGRLNNAVYSLFTVGMGLLIGFAFVINSFGIAGITPVKGIAVPFVSYGGSQILALCIAMGMVLMVSKKVQKERKEAL